MGSLEIQRFDGRHGNRPLLRDSTAVVGKSISTGDMTCLFWRQGYKM